MKIFIIFVLAIGVFSDDIVSDETDSIENFSASTDLNEIQSLIINGTQASEGQFPHQAGLLLKNAVTEFTWCSGSLIGKNWILTAAHCLNNVVSVKVNLGSIKRNAGKIVHNVASSCFHPHDDSGHDIALIWIPTVSYTSKIQPIKLPSIVPPYSDYSGRIVVISAWGKTGTNSTLPAPFLRYARFTVTNESYCNISDSIICVHASQAGTCGGDSGSPVALVSNGLLIGVHSGSKTRPCDVGGLSASVRVTSFLKWIKNITGIFY